uniref:Uncharacterized protein n=1 Tax=Arundo donax TaxID=35708 RepID=A0A0A9F7L0_ARUDO
MISLSLSLSLPSHIFQLQCFVQSPTSLASIIQPQLFFFEP